MPISRRELRRPAWLHMPRRTARVRLTALYGGLFLISGAALVFVTFLLFERATAFTKPELPQIPRTPTLQDLENLPLQKAFAAVANDQSQVVHSLNLLGQPAGAGPLPSSTHPPLGPSGPVASLESRLNKDQHQLAQATNHLAQAVHQLTHAGSIQAAPARRRLARAAGEFRNRTRDRRRARTRSRLARRRQNDAAHPYHHKHSPEDFLDEPSRTSSP